MQQLLEIEKIDLKEGISRLNWTKYKGRRNVCVNFTTDTDELNIVVHRYRNTLHAKDREGDLKLTEYDSLMSN